MQSSEQPTRRSFLVGGAAALGLLALDPHLPAAIAEEPSSARAAPWWLVKYPERSRVVETHSAKVLRGTAVDSFFLRQMVDQSIMSLTGAGDPDAAWRAILGESRRILLKFNSVGASIVRTNDPLAELLVRAISDAGYDRDGIGLVEVSRHLREELGTAELPTGWRGKVAVGNQEEELAAYVSWSDAIINVPLLKTHQIAGMSCSLINLSHAIIRRPALYHADGCAPFVGQIISSPDVTKRLKLCLVNALRTVVDRGPDARPEDVAPTARLLLGYDPVAIDAVAVSILAAERRTRGLPSTIAVPHLDSAEAMGLGRAQSTGIDRLTQVVSG